MTRLTVPYQETRRLETLIQLVCQCFHRQFKMNCEMEKQSVISTAVKTSIRRTVTYSPSGGIYSKLHFRPRTSTRTKQTQSLSNISIHKCKFKHFKPEIKLNMVTF